MAGVIAPSLILVASLASGGECLSFEPSEYSLVGALEHRVFLSPDSDSERTAVLLILDSPICVSGSDDELNSELVENVSEVQLVVPGTESDGLDDGSRVEVRGRLFSAHTAWHLVPVVMQVATMESAPNNALERPNED